MRIRRTELVIEGFNGFFAERKKEGENGVEQLQRFRGIVYFR